MEKLKFWCQKVLPLVYDDSLSYYELLCKVVNYLNNMIDEQKKIIDMYDPLNSELSDLKKEVDYLSSELEKVKNGDYVSLYIDSLSQWIDKNLKEMVSKIVKFVNFGISNTGYFVAYVPDAWDFINFDTIIDPNSNLYGHLILEW